MNTLTLRLLFVCLALLGTAATMQAEDLGSIRARMEQRLSQIDALKAKGALGENNRGFLEVRAAAPGADAVALAENNDRTTVYTAVAQKTGATADTVGRARAGKIAAISPAGVWLQHETGGWYKK
jgi:uncharacterized protein YdbL (DUF1318 family)